MIDVVQAYYQTVQATAIAGIPRLVKSGRASPGAGPVAYEGRQRHPRRPGTGNERRGPRQYRRGQRATGRPTEPSSLAHPHRRGAAHPSVAERRSAVLVARLGVQKRSERPAQAAAYRPGRARRPRRRRRRPRRVAGRCGPLRWAACICAPPTPRASPTRPSHGRGPAVDLARKPGRYRHLPRRRRPTSPCPRPTGAGHRPGPPTTRPGAHAGQLHRQDRPRHARRRQSQSGRAGRGQAAIRPRRHHRFELLQTEEPTLGARARRIRSEAELGRGPHPLRRADQAPLPWRGGAK